jgi:hypothetical protein
MKRIEGQVIYCGPNLTKVGLQHGAIFRDGILPHLYQVIEACPSVGPLFVPVTQYAVVRRELNFDFGRQMRGTTGKYVALYREVQNWIAKRSAEKPNNTGVKIQSHA